jgi:hypothetical protein
MGIEIVPCELDGVKQLAAQSWASIQLIRSALPAARERKACCCLPQRLLSDKALR